MIYHFTIIILGFIASLIMFSVFPVLRKGSTVRSTHRISVIIPARNEEKNLQLLLKDLKHQTIKLDEIICVDDGSTDRTNEIADAFGVKVIVIDDKPHDWTGKAWACQKGAESATGDLLLFLDADVRLSVDAIRNIVMAYEDNACTISVQPYHQTKEFYEQFSFFFNVIQIAANGTSLRFKTKNIGLYGPVILFDKSTYMAMEGHLVAKSSIVDDVVLGEKLNEMGMSFKLFLGGEDISFRMYGYSFRSLIQGWVKNYATGASKTPRLILVLVCLFIASCLTTMYMMWTYLSVYPYDMISLLVLFLYSCWVIELSRIGSKVGNFKLSTSLLFPLHLMFFIVVFLISMFKKHFQRYVTWKGRKINLD